MTIYEHFHADEHAFVDRASEWVTRASQLHEVRRTDFLDPRQAFIVQSLVNRQSDVIVRFEGGYAEAERKRALIAPEYRDLDSEDAEIAVIAITSDDHRIASLDHGDYLGSVLGLGIKRGKIGDIQVSDQGCHCLVAEDIAPFVHMNLGQVHRIRVQTEILPVERLQKANVRLEELNLTVASFRLDGIASDVFRLSRAKIVNPIKAGRCRINWKVEENPGTQLKAGDIVSLQGFGRFQVIDMDGVTKKGRYRVKIGKFV
ncbi:MULTISPECIES: RNA-binding protein [unclassified Paenibacillus]|uniref:YlmH family RNA-binding protein n=1 Tax=unclassified Paenibacillus TaxID=185978 RepID=UPI001C11FE61|nr:MULTISPECIES: YlmH/Sll1252 family protein [unclassified Paenibacillus]MBU5440537.1 RNA-binding protein [Paenibacillus sp. MSJ-34]CAH0122513.1 hypothetical protein PAE9249_05082 [Paenibacillus sp. CECT 9249]